MQSNNIQIDVYKEYIHRLRKVELDEVYIVITEDIFPTLKRILLLIRDTKFIETSVQAYYGCIKDYANAFLSYWGDMMDETIKYADNYSHTITKDEMLDLIQKNIVMQHTKQIDFGKEYLPITTSEHKLAYDNVETQFREYINALYAMAKEVEAFDKSPPLFDFTRKQMKVSLRRIHEVFEFTHTFISMTLADYGPRLKISLEEIVLRIQNNLQRLQTKCDESLNKLLHKLYDKNKEHLRHTREDRRCSLEIAEVQKSIQKIRNSLEGPAKENALKSLKEEYTHWEQKLKEFNKICDVLNKLKNEQAYIEKQLKDYHSTSVSELQPMCGTKSRCWQNIGYNLQKQKDYINSKIIDAARALMTHFCTKGNDRPYYRNNIGFFTVDDYGHQVYSFDNGLQSFHVDCDGNFVKIPENEIVYHQDKFGRYLTTSKGDEVYQREVCCSCYKLNDGMFYKVSKDCGHSDKPNKNCQMDTENVNDDIISADRELLDIKNKLDPDSVKYLWDNFGAILSETLADVVAAQPKNPIYYLAHRLLINKCKRTYNESEHEFKKAKEYRDNIHSERMKDAVAKSKSWKAKQVKRRKPEESDDSADWAAYTKHVSAQEFIAQLSFYAQ